MLEDINNILNIGEVPNLFPYEDMDTIQDEIRAELVKQKVKTGLDPE